MYDIIVIGAGPAGLTSAIYATRSNKKVLVLEAKTYGGQIINTSKIDNYPGMPHVSGIEFATTLYNQALELGAEIKFEKVINIEINNVIKKVVTNYNTYECRAIILAMGVDKRKLGLERENELVGKGVSYCATCDGMFFKNKEVAVIGGGDSALEEVEYLSNICSKVYLIHRREQFRGNEKQLSILKELKNVEFILNSNVTKLNGDKCLESIEVTDKLGNIKKLDVSAIFIAIGQIPETNNLLLNIDIDENGYINATEDTITNIDGVFVAGDIRRKKLRQLTTAVSDGSQAAVMACNYINNSKNSN